MRPNDNSSLKKPESYETSIFKTDSLFRSYRLLCSEPQGQAAYLYRFSSRPLSSLSLLKQIIGDEYMTVCSVDITRERKVITIEGQDSY
jgi:hypothetical protein